MKKKINKIWNIVTTTLLVVMMLLIAAMYLPKVFGIEPLIVLSGSMEPTYPTGSLLYVKEIAQEDVKENTPITFKLDDETLVTHRVVSVTDQGKYITKGDNNEQIDGGDGVSYDKIIGTPIFHVNKLGLLADKLSQMQGKIIFGTIVVVLIILMFLGDLIFGEDKKKVEQIKIEEDADKDEDK